MNNAIAIYKGGSSVILPNPKDEDIFCFYETKQDRLHALIHNHDHSKDYHFRLKSTAKVLFIGCYSYPYLEKISGEDLGFDKFDIHDCEKEYAKLLLDYINTWKEKGLENKHWYHIYLGYYSLKNGRGEKFSESQIKKAQEIHDKGITKTMLKNIFDYLTNIVNN